MRVLLSAGMTQGGRSGVGRYIVSLAEALAHGHPEVELHIAGLESDRSLFPRLAPDRWIPIPASMHHGPTNLLWHQTALRRVLKARHIDLVHIPSYRRMIWRCDIPQVATIHDCAPFIMREKYDFARGFFGRIVVPMIARRVDRIIAVSETTGADVIRWMQVPANQVAVVPNGIDHNQFHPLEPEAIRAFRYRKKLERPFFLYVARLEHPAKNHIRLIKAFEMATASGAFDGELILPGAPWHGSRVIEDAVAASPLRDRIRLEGFVNDQDLPLWYAAAEALVFPSLMEGFGLPLLEAQACGTRIACSNTTSLPEIAGPAGILFDGTDENSIANAMIDLASMDANERARREHDGIIWAARFTWQAHAREVARIYRETMLHEMTS